ncbi:hypothetical protein [Collimonas arenae]|nr:hypothetical protein [Collimonas arenae]
MENLNDGESADEIQQAERGARRMQMEALAAETARTIYFTAIATLTGLAISSLWGAMQKRNGEE